MAAGDIDGNGLPEVVATRDGTVVAVRLDGSAVPGWPVAVGAPDVPQLTPPILADLDGDRAAEVVFASASSASHPTRVHALRGDGTPVPGWPVDIPTGSLDYYHGLVPVAGDIDGDGEVEVLMVFQDSDTLLYAIDREGAIPSGWPRSYPLGPGVVPAIADIDNDGRNEVVCAAAGWDGHADLKPHIYAWDFNAPDTTSGRIEWGQLGGAAHRRHAWPATDPAWPGRRVGFVLAAGGTSLGGIEVERYQVGGQPDAATLTTRADGHTDDDDLDGPGAGDNPLPFRPADPTSDQAFRFAPPPPQADN
jgi:hypothetical protein